MSYKNNSTENFFKQNQTQTSIPPFNWVSSNTIDSYQDDSDTIVTSEPDDYDSLFPIYEYPERDYSFKDVLKKISEHLLSVKYHNGDISDVGNEVGYALGSYLNDMTSEEITTFFMGFRHGVSLTNNTH